MVGIPANVSRSVVYRKIGENILDRRKQRKDQMLPQGTLLKRILFFCNYNFFFKQQYKRWIGKTCALWENPSKERGKQRRSYLDGLNVS